MKDKWVSVKDRLPEERQKVLTYFPERDMIQLQRHCKQAGASPCGFWIGAVHWLEDSRITHWMPLPDPPKDADVGN